MIRKRKTGILRPHNGSVDCNDYIFTKLKAQNCLVTVQYFTDTRKVNVVQSYFWPEDREIIRTTTICPCINRDGDLCAQYIYDDVYSCDELEGSFTLEIAPEDQTEGPLISTDLTAKEQHFLSPDTDHFGLPLELRVLAEWIRMHPEYKCAELEILIACKSVTVPPAKRNGCIKCYRSARSVHLLHRPQKPQSRMHAGPAE